MEKSKQHSLDTSIAEFRSDLPQSSVVLDKLIRAGFSPTSLRRLDNDVWHQRPWFLYVQPPEALRERFELAPELLVIVDPFEKPQGRTLDAAATELAQTHRLDRGLMLYFTNSQNAEGELGTVLAEERRVLFLRSKDALDASDPAEWFRRKLIAQLGSMRPFAPGSPVAHGDFFGRTKELLDVERRLLQTTTPVGLFGLRKVGKTSLLRRLRAQWQDVESGANPPAILLYCDLQSVPFNRRNRAGIFDALRREAVQWVRLLPGIRSDLPWIHTEEEELSESQQETLGVAALNALLRWAKERDRKLVIAVDEYEKLFDNSGIPVAQGLDVLEYLRGLTQQNPSAFNFLFAGLHQRWAKTSRYEGRQNPLFGLYFPFLLGGFNRQELGTLMNRLGRRASLNFLHTAVDVAMEESGGHPFLARKLADLIDEGASPHREAPIKIDDLVVKSKRRVYDSEVVHVMEELANAVGDLEPGDGLRRLAIAFRDHDSAALSPTVAMELVSYGIAESERGFSPRIAVFARWLLLNVVLPKEAAHG